MGSSVIANCKTCGKPFVMGIDGTIHGCDKCTGVKRDQSGFAWCPGETVKLVVSYDGGQREVKRPKGI